jgi:hypothetical protein
VNVTDEPACFKKSYLGDGVYAQVESGMIKLTAENGIHATDTIYLELEVWDALKKYVQKIEDRAMGKG